MTKVRIGLWIAFLAFSVLSLSAAQASGQIEGTVTSARTGKPLPGIELTLNWANDVELRKGTTPKFIKLPHATSDRNGHFKFQNLSPANYLFVVNGEGMVRDDRHFRFTISAGQHISNFEIVLTESGIVRGHIVDSRGRPAVGVDVHLLKIAFSNGQSVLTDVDILLGQHRTNGRGEYRLDKNIPPGTYYLQASHRAEPGSNPGPEDQYLRTYYPGTVSVAAARLVTVVSGADSVADFAIQSGPTVTVTGVVNSSVPVESARPSTFFLVPRPSGGSPREPVELLANTLLTPVRNPPTPGSFVIRGVVPGSYDIYPVVSDRDRDHFLAPYTGRNAIEVGSKDLRGVVFNVHSGTDVMGRVIVEESGLPGRTIALDKLRLEVVARDDYPVWSAQNNQRSVDSNGAFSFSNVQEALYSIEVYGLPNFAYVADQRMGGQSIFDTATFKVGTTAPPPLEVVVAADGGVVRGSVSADAQKVSPNVTVVLVPESRLRGNMFLYRSVQSDATGNFLIEGIAPGKYKLFAFEHIPAGAHKNNEYMAPYESLGKELQLNRGATVDVSIRAIPGHE